MKSLTSLNCHSDWCPCINSPKWRWWILRTRLSIDHRRLVATEISILPKLCQFIGKQHGRRERDKGRLVKFAREELDCDWLNTVVSGNHWLMLLSLIPLWLLSAGSLSVFISPSDRFLLAASSFHPQQFAGSTTLFNMILSECAMRTVASSSSVASFQGPIFYFNDTYFVYPRLSILVH